MAGISADYITEAHGSFASNHCIDCKLEVKDIKETVLERKIPKCSRCGGLVKPDIVFFGESLPSDFFKYQREVKKAKLVIVIGTSLTVYPFAVLPQLAARDVPRVLINKEIVGDFGEDSARKDIIYEGDCDEAVKELAEELGWTKELLDLHTKVTSKSGTKDEETKDVESRVEDLVTQVERGLQINEEKDEEEVGKDDEAKENEAKENEAKENEAKDREKL